MVAALRLSNRWEMWDMSSPRDPRRTDLYVDIGQGEKSRIRTSNMLPKILENIFSMKLKLLIYCRNTFVWLFYTFPKTSTTWDNRHNVAFGSKREF